MGDSVVDGLTSPYRAAQDRKVEQRQRETNQRSTGLEPRKETVEGEPEDSTRQRGNNSVSPKSKKTSPKSSDNPGGGLVVRLTGVFA